MLLDDGVARGEVFEADDGDDVAGRGLFQVLLLVGVHADEAADALAASGARVEHRVARLECAAV